MNNFIITLFTFSGSLFFNANLFAQQTLTSEKNVAQNFRIQILQNYEANYLIYLPVDYGKSPKLWPLVLFLHGAGERGSDLEIVKRNGPPKLIEEGKEFSFILVCPQCPDLTTWDNKTLILLLDYIESKYNVDKSKEFLTGLSMGGQATWSLAIQYPERFAAIIPVCGRGYSQDVYVLKEVPVWAFHGAKDDIIPIEDGEKMVEALKKAGGNVKFTIYPEAGHDAWTETYNNPEIYDWLLSHTLEDEK